MKSGIRGVVVVTVMCLVGGGCGHRVSDAERRQALNRARLATSMMLEGELASALREARASVEQDPRCLDCQLTLAAVYGARSEYQRAEETLLEVLRREAANPYAQNQLAVVHINQGRPAEAIPHARRAAENEDFTGRHLAYYNLGWAYSEEGDYPAALDALSRAVREVPQMCLAFYRIAEVYFRQRNYAEALTSLEQALEVPEAPYESPTHEAPRSRTCDQMPHTHHLLAMTLLALGREEEAQGAFQRCLEIATARNELGRQCASQLNVQE